MMSYTDNIKFVNIGTYRYINYRYFSVRFMRKLCKINFYSLYFLAYIVGEV